MKTKINSFRKFFFIIPVILLFTITAIVMLLWNGILPEILGVNTITYWQSMGILILSKILFGGFSGLKNRHCNMHKKHFMDKMEQMTPDEKEKFKAEWKQRFNKSPFCREC